MLYACKDAAPVAAIESPVNDSADFKINSVPGQNFIIYPAEQFEQSRLISHIRNGVGALTTGERIIFTSEKGFIISPCLGRVLRLLLPLPSMVHVAPSTFWFLDR